MCGTESRLRISQALIERSMLEQVFGCVDDEKVCRFCRRGPRTGLGNCTRESSVVCNQMSCVINSVTTIVAFRREGRDGLLPIAAMPGCRALFG